MTNRARIFHIVGVSCAAAAVQVFLVLCVLFFRGQWRQSVLIFAISLGTAINLALYVLDLVFLFRKKELVYKSCILAFILALFSLVVFYILLRTGFLEIAGDEARLKEYLSRAGAWMSVLFVTLQFLQVVVLPIPSTVTVVAGAALFGALKGSLLSLLGIALGSLAAFLVGRYAGSKVVAWLVGKETLEKWLKKIKGKDKLLLSAMFLLPVFPDDVLCFVAGMSSMSLPLFLAVILVSRVLAIFTTSYSVTLIPFNTWWGILIWILLGILIILLFVTLYRKSDAILGWFEKKFHRETRIEEKRKRGEFTIEIVSPDGAIVKKGVARGGARRKPPKP